MPHYREHNDMREESEACSGMGMIYQRMDQHEQALINHQLDLDISQKAQDINGQLRALINIAKTCNTLQRTEGAENHYHEALSLAEQSGDLVAQTQSLVGLGNYSVCHN